MTRRTRRWSDLGPAQRALIIAASVVQVGLLGAALADLRRRDPAEIAGPRWVWAVVSLINFAGPISYFVFGRRRGDR